MPTVHNRLNKLQSYSLPSNKYIDLTLGASGTNYTAPADGWFYVDKTCATAHRYLVFQKLQFIKPGELSSSVSISGGHVSLLAPVKKGDILGCKYNADGATNQFRFIYAVGSAPQT